MGGSTTKTEIQRVRVSVKEREKEEGREEGEKNRGDDLRERKGEKETEYVPIVIRGSEPPHVSHIHHVRTRTNDRTRGHMHLA